MTLSNWDLLANWVNEFAVSNYAHPELSIQFVFAVCRNESAFEAARIAAHFGIETLGIREAA